MNKTMKMKSTLAMLMVKNGNGISWSHYQRPIILLNIKEFV